MLISIWDGLKRFFGGIFSSKEVLPRGICKRGDNGRYQVNKWYRKKHIPYRCFKELKQAKSYVAMWKEKIDNEWEGGSEC